MNTSFCNAFSSYPPVLLFSPCLILFLHSFNNKYKKISNQTINQLLLQNYQPLPQKSCCPQRNLMQTFTKWILMVKASYTPKLTSPLDSRKQVKRHNTPFPFSPLASPSHFFLLFIITRREVCWHQDLQNL